MYSIGVDLGGTNIAAAIVDEHGVIVKKGSVPTNRERAAEPIIKDMVDLCKQLIEESDISENDVRAIGIGSPGTVNSETGIIEYANNISFKDVEIVKIFKKYFDKDVFITNDANAAAYGEYSSGAGEIYDDFVAVTLGTGVGSGAIMHNKMIEGAFFGGAELGHTVIEMGGEPCSCGRKGCWEAYSSATALIREATKAAAANPTSKLNDLVGGDLDKMNAKVPFDAAQDGDAVAGQVIDWYLRHLAAGLVNVINIFQPEIVVLGGGVSAQKDKLIVPLKKLMTEEIYGGEDAFKTKLAVAELGNDAGIIGAAMLYKLHQ